MNTFIQDLSQKLYQQYGDKISNVELIFPNKRAGFYFREALLNVIDKPLVAPTVLSLEEFISRQSRLLTSDVVDLIFQLHEVFVEVRGTEEAIEDFYFWGEMLLKDFEEIDQFMVDPTKIFKVIRSQKELDETFYYLDEEHKRIINSFWKNFFELEAEATPQDAFVRTWEILLPVYETFHKKLRSQGLGYKGMIYREVAEKELGKTHHPLVFAGFNAFSVCEQKIIEHYLQFEDVAIYWDLDDYYFNDNRQEAGRFFREYADQKAFKPSFKGLSIQNLKRPKSVQVLEAPQESTQARISGQLLQEQGFTPGKTVVVVPDEKLLSPVLNALPTSVDSVNISMGYSIGNSEIFKLSTYFLDLFIEATTKINDLGTESIIFHHGAIEKVLSHSFIEQLHQKESQQLLNEIHDKNMSRLSLGYIEEQYPSLRLWFDRQLLSSPIHVLLKHIEHLKVVELNRIEKECFVMLYESLIKLQRWIGNRDLKDLKFFRKLLHKVAGSVKIPFSGEPLEGIQVMGFMETRNLDFEKVILLSANEGKVPSTFRQTSFVPYNIRRGFGLPTHEFNDGLYSYLFYRVMQRAKDVTILYSSVSDAGMLSEMSRYLYQLKLEQPFPVKFGVVTSNITITDPKPIVIEKSKEVMLGLERFLENGILPKGEFPSKLSPSALNTYLHCRLQFYFRYVKKLYERKEVIDVVDPATFGNILHEAVEKLYKQLMKKKKSKTVEPADFFFLRAGVDGAIQEAFKAYFFVEDKRITIDGKNMLALEVMKKFVNRVLDFDEQYAPFDIIGLEVGGKEGFRIDIPVKVNGITRQVKLKGIIDRIDKKGEAIRVLDYKTGKDDKLITSIDSLFDRSDPYRNKAGFQVFYYALLYQAKFGEIGKNVSVGLYNIRELFSSEFDHQMILGKGKDKVTLSDVSPYLLDYTEGLKRLLNEIYDLNTPFDQVDDIEKCTYCPYSGICSR